MTTAATYRWVLLGLVVVYGFAAMGQRDRRLRHGVALIDAAGLAMLAIAGYVRCSARSSSASRPGRSPAWRGGGSCSSSRRASA